MITTNRPADSWFQHLLGLGSPDIQRWIRPLLGYARGLWCYLAHHLLVHPPPHQREEGVNVSPGNCCQVY